MRKKQGRASDQTDRYYINRIRIKGWTVQQIADELDCSVPTVYRTLTARGLLNIKRDY